MTEFHPRSIGLRDREMFFDDIYNDERAQQMAMTHLLARGCTELYCVWPPAHDMDGSMRYRMVGSL